ncbi:MAG: hypothetical protein IJH67_04960 [Thermoguttaceae bacterium]|nr:hypothetical protein [Thermoguttaceae bacterium]
MTIKPEWGWTPEVFVVFSTINGNPMFVFRIGRLPNIPYDEGCSFSEAFLRTYRKIVWDYLEQNDYKGGKFNIDLRFKHDLSNAQKECCYADTSEAVQLLQENAYRVKEYLVKICRANAETGIQSDGSVPVPFVASRKETVSSCTAEVKQPDDESTRHLRNIVKEDKQHTKQLSSIQTDIRDGFEATQKTIREVGETIGEKIAEEIRQAVKSAEQTASPSPEQTAFESMKKEYYNITGKGHVGRRRLLLFEKYNMTVPKIWEFETGDCWEDLDAGLRAAATHKIEQAIDRARNNQSEE